MEEKKKLLKEKYNNLKMNIKKKYHLNIQVYKELDFPWLSEIETHIDEQNILIWWDEEEQIWDYAQFKNKPKSKLERRAEWENKVDKENPIFINFTELDENDDELDTREGEDFSNFIK